MKKMITGMPLFKSFAAGPKEPIELFSGKVFPLVLQNGILIVFLFSTKLWLSLTMLLFRHPAFKSVLLNSLSSYKYSSSPLRDEGRLQKQAYSRLFRYCVYDLKFVAAAMLRSSGISEVRVGQNFFPSISNLRVKNIGW